MYDKILVPTDGSAATEGAVEHAIELAKQYDATVHALYVVDTGAYSSLEMGSDIVIEALQEEGNTAVEEVEERGEEAGVDVVTTVETGIAHRVIVDYVAEEGIDLVVMGTHGRTGVGRFLLGSVAEKVVRTADAPVMTVRSGDKEAEADGGPAVDEA
ncbi:universal stress protein [Halobellus sp. H-GB7]|uniref:universal stress protein n=1 Tax=Halobellus sp. H-GB7 TaxID=3069756 RepID=UPI0027B4C973|nr:universal stress protein [Halobellus sp. H-GB7]MDQ2053872.1 universal stress protein [Halobellus sp. H-GB7]